MSEITRGIIDRFEGDLAVVEFENKMKVIPIAELPLNADVGDVLLFENGKVTVSKDETEKLRKEIKDLMNEVWED